MYEFVTLTLTLHPSPFTARWCKRPACYNYMYTVVEGALKGNSRMPFFYFLDLGTCIYTLYS